MEGVGAAFLAHVCGPRFAAIEEGAQHTGLVDYHLGVLGEHLIFQYYFSQLGHSVCGFSGAPVYLSVHRKVCPKVGEVFYYLQGVVIDLDRGDLAGIPRNDVRLLQADCESKLSAGVCKAIDQPLEGLS